MTAKGTDCPWQVRDGIVRLRVRVTPRAGRDAVHGCGETGEGPAVLVKVRSVPSGGEANAAVIRVIAEWLDLPKGRVTLAAGGKSRVKLLAIDGAGSEIVGVLEQLTASITDR